MIKMSLRGLYYVYVTGFLGGKQKMKKFLKNFFGFKKSLTYSARDEKKSENIFFLYRQKLARIFNHIRSFCR